MGRPRPVPRPPPPLPKTARLVQRPLGGVSSNLSRRASFFETRVLTGLLMIVHE
jgi:hypothetical protein